LGWVAFSKAKLLKKCERIVNAFKARLDRFGCTKQLNLLVVLWVGLDSNVSTCSWLGWVGSVSSWVGLDRVTQNGPMYNSAHPDLRDPPMKQPASLARDLRALKAPSWVQVRMFDPREDDLD